jgi:threonine dehydrogenase-like Zn-dependent dehydrogenase
MLGRALGAPRIVGTDLSPERCKLAEELDLVDAAVAADGDALSHVLDATGPSGYEVTIDCSGAAPARKLALEATGRWGRCVFVGEGGTVDFEVSPLLIHKQVTLYGSWVTSVKHLADLVERLARWGIHPETTCTDRLPLALADEAYRLADEGKGGKVCIVFEE